MTRELPPAATGKGARRQHDQRNPQVVVVGKLHALRHHADDGGRTAVHANGLAEDIRIAAVSTPPGAVAQDHDRMRRLGHRRLPQSRGQGWAVWPIIRKKFQEM